MRKTSLFTLLFSISLMAFSSDIDSILAQLNKADNKEKLEIISNLPSSLKYSSSESLLIYEEGIRIAEELKAYRLQIDLMTDMTYLLEQQDRQEEGHDLLLEIKELSLKHKYIEGEAACYKLLGDFYFNIKDYQKSIFYYIRSTEIYQSLNDKLNLGYVNYNLGLIYRSMWQNTEALVYLKEAYINAVANHQIELQAEVESLLGCTYIRAGKVDSGLVQLSKSRELCLINKFETIDVYVAKSMAVAYNIKHQYEDALREINYCLSLTKSLNLQSEYAEYLNIKAEIQKNRGHYKEAIMLAHESIEKGKERGLKEIELDGLRILVEAHSAMGNSKKANFYFQQYHPLRNKLEWERNYQQTADMQVKYDTERRIAEKQLEIALLDERLKRDRSVKYGLAFGALLLLIMSVLLVNRWKLRNNALQAQKEKALLKKEYLEKEMHLKNQELSSLTVFITEKNKMLFDLQNQLTNLKGINTDSNKELISLSREIDRNINFDKDWETMKMHFENVYPDFFTKLSTLNPRLTPLDLKHCVYLKMKLSNKELARILNIEPNSVKTLRYRLKKKLNLTVADDLFKFIENELTLIS